MYSLTFDFAPHPPYTPERGGEASKINPPRAPKGVGTPLARAIVTACGSLRDARKSKTFVCLSRANRANPDRSVYVLFLSPELKCGDDVAAAFSLVTHYRNVRLRHVDLAAYTRDTPVEDFVGSGVMDDGLWPVEQLSDLMRILTLWKFGGVYVDLDVVSLRPMPRTANFISAEYPGNMLLASSAIGVQNKDVAEQAILMFK